MSASEPRPRPSSLGVVIQTAALLFFWLVFIGLILVVVPRFRRFFDEFGMKLPDVTTAVIAVSDWSWKYVWLSIPASLAAVLGFTGLIAYLRYRPGAARLANLLALFAIGGLVAASVVVAVSLALPTVWLQQGLAK